MLKNRQEENQQSLNKKELRNSKEDWLLNSNNCKWKSLGKKLSKERRSLNKRDKSLWLNKGDSQKPSLNKEDNKKPSLSKEDNRKLYLSKGDNKKPLLSKEDNRRLLRNREDNRRLFRNTEDKKLFNSKKQNKESN